MGLLVSLAISSSDMEGSTLDEPSQLDHIYITCCGQDTVHLLLHPALLRVHVWQVDTEGHALTCPIYRHAGYVEYVIYIYMYLHSGVARQVPFIDKRALFSCFTNI